MILLSYQSPFPMRLHECRRFYSFGRKKTVYYCITSLYYMQDKFNISKIRSIFNSTA